MESSFLQRRLPDYLAPWSLIHPLNIQKDQTY
jgi:hypothetical protein